MKPRMTNVTLYAILVLICQALGGMIAHAQGEVDGEGFPISGNEPETTPPAEVSDAESFLESLTPVDPRDWSIESYLPVTGFPGAWWYQYPFLAWEYNNAQPTLLYSDFSALWTALEVDVLSSSEDDDYIGFAVGFQPGDASNRSADYLLIDWKRETQWFDFQPWCTPGSTAYRGLAASRVNGVPTADEFWGHLNFDATCSDLSNGLKELARANTLGDVGYPLYQYTHFRLEYTPTALKVYVNGSLQIDISGTFGDGRWAFYDFSQGSTGFYYPKVETVCLPVNLLSLVGDPLVVPVDSPISFTGEFTDGCAPIAADWVFDDGDTLHQDDVMSPVTSTHTYSNSGVYEVMLTVTDNQDNTDTETVLVVVYDPSDGFVTGGGWIESPEGALPSAPSLSGKANFGFVSKYKQGTDVPTGNTEFQFNAGGLNFHSSSYEWLVVTGSEYAKFKGTGTVADVPGEYKFMIWAGDSEPDTFRTRIWAEDDIGNEFVVYDNGFGQPLGGGSIVIHTK